MSKNKVSKLDETVPMVKRGSNPKYAVVAVEDIICAVGLIPTLTDFYKVASNDMIFKQSMKDTAGKISTL